MLHPQARPPAPGGQEPLSEREVQVLRLLASDLTGPEIADQLLMSVNTFRTNTRHVYTKLDVKTRRAAVSHASEFGLLQAEPLNNDVTRVKSPSRSHRHVMWPHQPGA
jgi:LuxR family transcriptional regulator, maltose regulon positive regulatory protein